MALFTRGATGPQCNLDRWAEVAASRDAPVDGLRRSYGGEHEMRVRIGLSIRVLDYLNICGIGFGLFNFFTIQNQMI